MTPVLGLSKNVVVICVTVLVLGTLGIVGWIFQVGADPDRILGWIGTIVPPIIIGMMALIKVDLTQQRVEDVHKQTNGTLTALTVQVQELQDDRGTDANQHPH